MRISDAKVGSLFVVESKGKIIKVAVVAEHRGHYVVDDSGKQFNTQTGTAEDDISKQFGWTARSLTSQDEEACAEFMPQANARRDVVLARTALSYSLSLLSRSSVSIPEQRVVDGLQSILMAANFVNETLEAPSTKRTQ